MRFQISNHFYDLKHIHNLRLYPKHKKILSSMNFDPFSLISHVIMN